MDSGDRSADYVLFYAKVSSFLEDGCCTLKHEARRAFEQAVIDGGLTIDKYSVGLPKTGGDSATATSNSAGGSRRGKSSKRRTPYKAFYWGIRATDRALLDEAEYVKLELPLKDHASNPMAMPAEPESAASVCCRSCSKSLQPDDEVLGVFDDSTLNYSKMKLISAPFVHSKKHLFYGHSNNYNNNICNNKDTEVGNSDNRGGDVKFESGSDGNLPLTGAQRIYLTHSILHRIDISQQLRTVLGPHPGTKLCPVDCMYCRCLKKRIIKNYPIVLDHLLQANIFADAFAVHDKTSEPANEKHPNTEDSNQSSKSCCLIPCCGKASDSTTVIPMSSNIPEVANPSDRSAAEAKKEGTADLRNRLRDTWRCGCQCSFQPLSLIRLYFGEKLAFYYAWLGHLIWCLLSLAGVGLAFLIYGFVHASQNYTTQTELLIRQLELTNATLTHGNTFSMSMIQPMQYFRLMFENPSTISFGVVLTAWSLVTTEYWKKYETNLSHKWDVNNHDLAEKRKPSFTPRRKIGRRGCCTRQTRSECRQCFGVFSFIAFCIVTVLAVTVAYKVAKLVASNAHCSGDTSHSSRASCLFLSIILPIMGHLVAMAILDWVYSRLAKKMTDWEGHEFASDYDSSYAMKAFAFRCANNYATLFYIAFVRQETAIFGEYTDSCATKDVRVDCFNLLSVYTAGYIIGKSLLKIFTDTIRLDQIGRRCFTCLSGPIRRLLCTCSASCMKAAYNAELNTITALEGEMSSNGFSKSDATIVHFGRERVRKEEKSQDALLDEYLEKLMLHGFTVLFGSACCATPLATLLAMIIDLRLDAKRLVQKSRRPVPQQASGIGVYNRLHELISHAGIFSTGGILAFSNNSLETHGYDTNATNRLILFTAFTGIMQLFKHLISACASGRSSKLKLQLKWKYQNIPRILDTGAVAKDELDSLTEMQNSSRWFHTLLPCFASAVRPAEQLEPHQV